MSPLNHRESPAHAVQARRHPSFELLVPGPARLRPARPSFEALVRAWSPSRGRLVPDPRPRAGVADRLPLDPRLAPSAGRLAAASRGDRHAWATLLSPLRDPLERLAEARIPPSLRARFDAQDVVQGACLRAFRQFGGFRTDSGGTGFLGWMVRVLDTTIADEVRRHRRQCRDVMLESGADPTHEPLLAGEAPAAGLERREERARLAAALGRLSDDDRDLLVERYFQELTHDEIARRRGWSEPTARRRQADALARLSASL